MSANITSIDLANVSLAGTYHPPDDCRAVEGFQCAPDSGLIMIGATDSSNGRVQSRECVPSFVMK